MKYNALDLGQIEAIVNKLGGMRGVKDFLSGKTAVSMVESASVVEPALEIWKTINLGTGPKTADDFRQAIDRVNGKVSGWASDIMDIPDFAQSVSQSPMELDLCVATTAEILGEKGRKGTLSEIYADIIRMGGHLLPAEAGPQLRLQYNDQPNGECLFMIMEPIKDSVGGLYVFGVRRADSDFWLGARYVRHDYVWPSDYRWVFSRLRGQ